jgi:hypothetical protein
MRYFLLFVLLFFLSSIPCAFAQSFEEELRNAIKESPRLELRLDSRHSFISERGVRVIGIKGGIQFDDKLSFGLGYNWMNSSIENHLEVAENVYRTELVFYNFSPYVEYVFYRDERWELSIPVQFGLGSSYYRNLDGNGPNEFARRFVLSYEPAITSQYRFLKYFGVGLGIGYRLMLKPNPEVKERFTSPVYIFKTKLYFQDLLRDLRKIN